MESTAEKRIRKLAFWPALGLWIWITSTNIINGWIDPCLLNYAFGSLACKWTVFLSVAHWINKGEASTVFKWLVALVAGLSINYDFQWYARNMRINGLHEQYDAFIHSTWWHMRDALVIVSLIYLMAVIAGRMLDKGEKANDS